LFEIAPGGGLKEREMNEEQRKQFEDLCKPLMKFLCENCHPHVTVIVEPTQAELVEGDCTVVTSEFLVD
jgi:hypothetical protein